MKLFVVANFSVQIRQEVTGPTGRPIITDVPKRYTKGMLIDGTKIPEGHTEEDWLAKGLVKAA